MMVLGVFSLSAVDCKSLTDTAGLPFFRRVVAGRLMRPSQAGSCLAAFSWADTARDSVFGTPAKIIYYANPNNTFRIQHHSAKWISHTCVIRTLLSLRHGNDNDTAAGIVTTLMSLPSLLLGGVGRCTGSDVPVRSPPWRTRRFKDFCHWLPHV